MVTLLFCLYAILWSSVGLNCVLMENETCPGKYSTKPVSTHLDDIKLVLHLLCDICDGGGGVGVHVIEVVTFSTTAPSPTGCCLGHVVKVQL